MLAKSATQFDQWFAGKQLGHDWASFHFENWAKWLKRERFFNHECNVIEVGSWEGRSALLFLNYLPKSTVVCVDTFEGSAEHAASDVSGIEARFDANVQEFGARVHKFKGRSSDVLPSIAITGLTFDVAYIDGNHRSDAVYSDGVLCWSMLKKGGLLIFDDYEWMEMTKPEDNPSLGINTFLNNFHRECHFNSVGYQVALEKL